MRPILKTVEAEQNTLELAEIAAAARTYSKMVLEFAIVDLLLYSARSCFYQTKAAAHSQSSRRVRLYIETVISQASAVPCLPQTPLRSTASPWWVHSTIPEQQLAGI